MAEKLVQQNLHPHRHAQAPLGDQLGRRRGSDGAGAAGAGAGTLVAAPANASAIGPHLDLQLFGILRSAGRQRLAAAWADALRGGQFAEFLVHRQMTVVAPPGTRAVGLLSAPAGRGRFLHLAVQDVAAIRRRGLFALPTEELTLQVAVFPAQAFDLGLHVAQALHGAGVLGFPIPHLLAQFQVFAPQVADFLAELRHFLAQLLHPVLKISLPARAGRSHKHAVHDSNACNRTPPTKARRFLNQNGFGGCLRRIRLGPRRGSGACT